jgi:large subunit ribosomal protein L15
VRGSVAGIKILGGGELKHALKIEVDKISASARAKVDKAGGTVALREPQTREAVRPQEGVNLTENQASEERIPKAAAKARSRKKAGAKTSQRSKKPAIRKS